MYLVLEAFDDLVDHAPDEPWRSYAPGDLYPDDGFTPSDERIAELAGTSNVRSRPLIRPVEEKKKPAVSGKSKTTARKAAARSAKASG